MSSPKNLEYKKTSFLNKANSAFIEEMYVKFINKDPSLSESWIEYFSSVDAVSYTHLTLPTIYSV